MPNLEKATDIQINTLEKFMDSHKVEFRKSIRVSDINNFEAKVLIRFLRQYLQVPQTNIGNRSLKGPKCSEQIIDKYTSIIIKYLFYKQEKDISDNREVTDVQLSHLERKLKKHKMKLAYNIKDLTSTEISYIINSLDGYCPFIEVKQEYLIKE